jgi:hypothetical protein
LFHGVGSFSIVVIGTYAASANFHQPRDTTAARLSTLNEGQRVQYDLVQGQRGKSSAENLKLVS